MTRFATPGGVHNLVPGRVVFGAGTACTIGDELAAIGATRAVVVTTPGRRELGTRVLELVGERGAGLYGEAVAQVPQDLLDVAQRAVVELGADCLVAVGGGAATGFAKGIALGEGLPYVAIPTTYSGSEMTGFCGITINGVKRMHDSVRMVARTVIYDAQLSLTLPPDVTASSALNALAHCVDGVYLPSVSPLIATAAERGARVIATWLPRVLEAPDDLVARNELLFGAYLSGAVLSGGFALQHGVAHALGGTFGIEHGLAHAIVLPHVAAYLETQVAEPLGPLAAALGSEHIDRAIFDMLEASGLATSLASAGVAEEDLERIVDVIVDTEQDGSVAPFETTRADLATIVRRAFEGRRPQ